MIRNEPDGKLFDIIRSIYYSKSCVKKINTLSDFIQVRCKVITRKSILPFLLSLFVNDLELYLEQNPNASITLDQLSMYLLMFVDDTVIFFESVEGLQLSLNNLESGSNCYCR